MTKFEEFYGNLRVKDMEPIRNEIEQHVSPVSFLTWKRGTFEPDAKWWPIINSIAEKYGYPKPYTV